jgi:two-component system OmpR family response regulator
MTTAKSIFHFPFSILLSMRILIIEDDQEVADYLIKGLTEAGHLIDQATDGKIGLTKATSENYDVMVIDRLLPQLDGLTIIKTLRASGNQTPILVLSALSQVAERVRGLQEGGDDYLTKPFAFSELLARIEALQRRRVLATETTLRVGDLNLDLLTREARRAGQLLELQPREFTLLEYLMRHAGQVVTRAMLLEEVWGYHFDPQTNVIDVHISRLRGKLDKNFEKSMLHTVRGAGYILHEPD